MPKVGFKQAIENAEKKQQSSDKKKSLPYLRVSETPVVIRFDTTNGEDSLVEFGQHYVKFNNGWTKTYSCPDYGKDGERTCVVCKSKKGVDVVDNNFTRNYGMRIIEREAVVEDKELDSEGNLIPVLDKDGNPKTHTEDVVKYYKFSAFVMTNYITPIYTETEDVGDRDYEVYSSKEKNDKGQERTVYHFEPVSTKARPLSKEDKVLLAEATPLENIEPPYDENHFNETKVKELRAGGNRTASAPITEESIAGFFKQDDDTPTQLDDISNLIKNGRNAKPAADEDDGDDDIAALLARHRK